jgi:hypothetical protein
LANDPVQNKSIKRGIECIDFEGFDQVRFEGSIEASREGLRTSYPYARGAQSNLIWAMRWGENTTQNNKKRIQADLGNKMAARLPNYTKRLFQQL